MKAAYIQKTIYLIFFLAVLFSAGCGTSDKSEPDPIGIKIKSPKFDEISTIYSGVEVSLKFTNSNSGGVTECNVFIGTDTKVKGTCGDMPFGTYAYILEYKYQGLSIAKSIGSITIDENNTETPITLLDKNIDEDNDGCSNLQEVIVGSNPLVQDTCIPPPTDLTAKSVSTTRIDLTWTESSGATGYKIFRREGSDGADQEIGTSAQTSYSDTGLNADTEYCYKVSANGNGAESIPTDLVCAKTENGLVAFYPFNGNANDESGNGNNGTVNGATLTVDRFGKADSAYSFDGVNDYVQLPSTSLMHPNQFTLSAWVYLKEYVSNGDGNIGANVLSNYACCNAPNGFIFYISQDGRASIRFSEDLKSNTIIPLNTWTHIVATYSLPPNGNTYKVYLNGTIDGNKTHLLSSSLSSSSASRIGKGSWYDGNEMLFSGLIDDIRIYNRALTDAEILTLYNEGK